MKTLFANGCSWTYGGGLDKTQEQIDRLPEVTWPGKLSKLLGYDNFVNLASGCGSNQRVVRTTIDWILKQDPETLKNTVAVIQWTEWSRYEYYYAADLDTQWDDQPNAWSLCKIGNVINAPERYDEAQYHKMVDRNNKRLETYTDVEGYYVHLAQCETLASIFKRYGIEYYYWNFTTPMFRIPEPRKSFLLDNYNWLEPKGLHSWDYERIGSHDPHPNDLGHTQLAHHILNAIKTHFSK